MPYDQNLISKVPSDSWIV
ncbi:hypothetical protein F383_29328 [Gossypium arboreum]|uniref:Uncharacterized protein n=1 Tax=Gossypium arboreum TaxID=29729 RepID=A0A0B0MZP6_GOSAR|nr:hypothetical protein F383_29328 [Gossypium arboreum]